MFDTATGKQPVKVPGAATLIHQHQTMLAGHNLLVQGEAAELPTAGTAAGYRCQGHRKHPAANSLSACQKYYVSTCQQLNDKLCNLQRLRCVQPSKV
jgi:hypothetical protein